MKLLLGLGLLFLLGSTQSAVIGEGSVCNTEHCKELSKQLRSYMNLSANPCEDFDQYACGNFHNTVPPNYSMFTLRSQGIAAEIDQSLQSKAETSSNSSAVKFITKFYQQCGQSDNQGLEPLKKSTEELRQIHGTWSKIYAKVVGSYALKPFFELNLVYGKNETRFISISVGTGGLSSASFMYPPLKFQVEAYRKYIHDAAVLMGVADDANLKAGIDRIVKLEGEIAKIHYNSGHGATHYYKLGELKKVLQNRADWTSILNEIKALSGSTQHSNLTETDEIEIVNLQYMYDTLDVLNKASQSDVLDLFTWLVVQQYGPLTSDKFRNLEIEFRKTIGDHRPTLPKQVCLDLTRSKFPHVVERVYADMYFEGEVEKQATRMISELRGSFKSILEETTWLDSETQKLALEKLEAITPHLGVPKWVEDSGDLDRYYGFIKKIDVVPEHFLESIFRLQEVIIRDIFDENGAHKNNSYSTWIMPPLTANAAYVPRLNAIIIPTGIIRPLFFDADRPYVINYGQLGAVIGHELTHGFDNNGRRYDKDGKFRDWWTKKTLAEFESRADCFVKQYGGIYDEYSKTQLKGEQTLGENIADNGGLKESFRAFENHQKSDGHPSPVLPDLKASPEQLYFLSWAWNWCDTSTPDRVHRQIQVDVHSPHRYRTLIPLSNSPDFEKAFNCPASSKMNPTHKCAVW